MRERPLNEKAHNEGTDSIPVCLGRKAEDSRAIEKAKSTGFGDWLVVGE